MTLLSYKNLHAFPAGAPLAAEDVLEFHASRILLLVHLCGDKDGIAGLTKLAKLDFFVRYPEFFARACAHLKQPVPEVTKGIEATMVRHHYGPWDHRYYHVLAFLEGTRLLTVTRIGARAYRFTLTEAGIALATRLKNAEPFQELSAQMTLVRKRLGNRKGDTLKRLVYELFREEVADRPLGAVID